MDKKECFVATQIIITACFAPDLHARYDKQTFNAQMQFYNAIVQRSLEIAFAV